MPAMVEATRKLGFTGLENRLRSQGRIIPDSLRGTARPYVRSQPQGRKESKQRLSQGWNFHR
jgi:hypothetical protein